MFREIEFLNVFYLNFFLILTAEINYYIFTFNIIQIYSGKELTETEPEHGDTLIQLTFHLLMNLNTEKGKVYSFINFVYFYKISLKKENMDMRIEFSQYKYKFPEEMFNTS